MNANMQSGEAARNHLPGWPLFFIAAPVTCMVAYMIVGAKGIISRLLVMNRNRKYFYHFVLALPDEDQFPF